MPSPESAAMEKTVSARLPPGLAGRLSYEAPCQEIISGIKDQKRFELPFLIRAFIRIVPFGTQ
jgi:hypothetical protein